MSTMTLFDNTYERRKGALLEQVLQRLLPIYSSEELEALQQRAFLQSLIQFALIIIATAPVLAAYPFVQKHFVRGVMIGAIKG